MKLSELLTQLDVVEHAGCLDVEVVHVTRDSRAVREGSVFVAIRGATVDGHSYVPALTTATAVVVDRADVEVPDGVACIVVPDTRAALGPVAAAVAGHPSRQMAVVGVTGTNGKTTVTTLVAQTLSALGRSAGRIGTTGTEIAGKDLSSSLTTPEAPQLQDWLVQMVDAGCTVAAMEVSSIGLTQRRVDGTRFAIGVFTHFGRDHLDFHGTMEAYAAAKARLFQELLREPGGVPRALVFADDPAWVSMDPPSDRWTYGFDEGRDVQITAWESSREGLTVTMQTPQGEATVRSPMLGRHNAANLAAAVGIGLLLGEALEPWCRALQTAMGAPGRMERVPHDDVLVLVDYAHTPDAIEAAVKALAPVTPGRLWVVFGCGGDRDRQKRPEMGRAALSADRVVVTSDNPRSEDPEAIIADILAGIDDMGTVQVESDRRAAIHLAIRGAAPGDTVLLAGKGHERTQTLGDRVIDLDDRAVARDALEAR